MIMPIGQKKTDKDRQKIDGFMSDIPMLLSCVPASVK